MPELIVASIPSNPNQLHAAAVVGTCPQSCVRTTEQSWAAPGEGAGARPPAAPAEVGSEPSREDEANPGFAQFGANPS